MFLRERGIPVVREAWLTDSIEKKQAETLDAYDIASDIAVEGKGLALDQQDSSVVALETLTAEVLLQAFVFNSDRFPFRSFTLKLIVICQNWFDMVVAKSVWKESCAYRQ